MTPTATKLRLAKAYDDAATHIEERPEDYCFLAIEDCNCGILAQHLLGVDHMELLTRIYGDNKLKHWRGSWSAATHAPVCSTTGLPVHTLLRELAQAGCTPQELADLENVGSDRPTVIAYMRRRAAELRAEVGAGRIVEHKPERGVEMVCERT